MQPDKVRMKGSNEQYYQSSLLETIRPSRHHGWCFPKITKIYIRQAIMGNFNYSDICWKSHSATCGRCNKDLPCGQFHHSEDGGRNKRLCQSGFNSSQQGKIGWGGESDRVVEESDHCGILEIKGKES